MMIQIGAHTIVRSRDIVGIFDLDQTTISARTRRFLTQAEKRGELSLVAEDLPKSFVVCESPKIGRAVYLAQPMPATLYKRMTDPAEETGGSV